MTNLVNSATPLEVIVYFKPSFPRFIKAIDDMAEYLFASEGFFTLPKLSRRNTFHYYRRLRQLLTDFHNLPQDKLLDTFQNFRFDVGDYEVVENLVKEFYGAFVGECDSPEVITFENMETNVTNMEIFFKSIYEVKKFKINIMS